MQKTPADRLLRGLQGTVGSQWIDLVTTDSRQARPGSVFVAFPGARFDGHDFAAQCVAAGCDYVVLNHPVEGVPAEKTVLCPDSYRAMMQIGENYRAAYHPVMVGVTGSVGKTTTKQFCHAVLSAFGETIKTEGNQNNELGMPRTLLRLAETTEYAVIEMGMSALGEIERLARCAKPDAGIITCIGVSHMETLGSRENILKAKLEICAGLPEGAPLALNADDEYLRGAALPAHVRPVWYALEDTAADVRAEAIEAMPGGTTRFVIADAQYGRFDVTIPAMGRHNVYNALAAYAAATRLGLDAARAAAALAGFEQTGMRQHLVRCGGVDVIEDCYNANPDSMLAALKMFSEYPCQKRIALLGDMLELGAVTRQAHHTAGVQAAQLGVTHLITYGEAARLTAEAAAQLGVCTVHAASYEQAAQQLLQWAQPGDAVLVKGSRSMMLENALKPFYAARGREA